MRRLRRRSVAMQKRNMLSGSPWETPQTSHFTSRLCLGSRKFLM